MKQIHTKKSRRSGFTLIEIMVVVLIVGLLLGTVGPNIWNALFSSQTKIAANQIRQFHNALDQWKLNNYKYPDSLESLTEADPITGDPLLKRIPLDPWQNEYQYEFDQDNNPIITSFGADGSPGGEAKDADISTETIDQQ
jgi:general secretion pathway protein G